MPALPSFLDSWARWEAGPRTAALALVAALAILALGAVGSTGNVKYESRRSVTRAMGGTNDLTEKANAGRWPVLARHGFWSHAKRSSVLWAEPPDGRVRPADARARVALPLLRHAECWFGPDFGANGCLEPSTWQTGADATRWAVLVVAAVLLLVGSAVRVALLRIDPAGLDAGTTHSEPPPCDAGRT